ncbi:hypothetical protein [Gorillibacterium sp. CAU 1737]|uniref:LiaF transmembrane domain-containing protein n=1 Tax=Gorillibacterium sp. CAU 1737 TaxID=3140362 RepID=UPI0032616E1A
MKLQGKNALALILIVCGALILLGKLGPLVGWVVSLIVPIALIAFGYLGIKNGKRLIGGFLVFLGAVILIGKLTPLIGWVIAALLIAFGISILTKKNNSY